MTSEWLDEEISEIEDAGIIPANILMIPKPVFADTVPDPDNPEGFVHAVVLPDMSRGQGRGCTPGQATWEAIVDLMLNRATQGFDLVGEA